VGRKVDGRLFLAPIRKMIEGQYHCRVGEGARIFEIDLHPDAALESYGLGNFLDRGLHNRDGSDTLVFF
jgi:hypothetical protein